MIKGWAGISESYVSQVPVLTLDRILGSTLQDKKALILVDVEGAEHAMLKGATRTLRQEVRPIWMVEIGSTTHQPEGVTINPHLADTFKTFFNEGYVVTTADSAQKRVDFDLVSAVAEGKAEFSVHNFVFR